MDYAPETKKEVRQHALLGLREALEAVRPRIVLDMHGYSTSCADNLVSSVTVGDFGSDLGQGSGNELSGKFRAAHSSSALAVNCFGPFKRNLSDLRVCGAEDFMSLCFEKKCPTGLHGTPPNLDVLMERADRVVAIESKCTEYLSPHTARFSMSYRTRIRDARRQSTWFREMRRLIDEPHAYGCLDAAQLIKHALGLMYCYPDHRVTLLYLYWEPLNAVDFPVFEEHRREIAEFADRIAAPCLAFEATTYNDLRSWASAAPLQNESNVGHIVVESIWEPKLDTEPVRRKSRDFQ